MSIFHCLIIDDEAFGVSVCKEVDIADQNSTKYRKNRDREELSAFHTKFSSELSNYFY